MCGLLKSTQQDGKRCDMKFNEMTIEQLKAYRASVEAYGTASELYEVEERIRELEGGNKDE